jgi:endoglucanase
MDVAVDTYVPPSCPTCPLKVDYFSNNPTETSTKEVRFYLDLVNKGTMVQDLTQITVRYWFTSDGSTSQTFNCDYAMLVCPTATFVKIPTPTATADTYLELAFASGSIPPNGDTGVIQGRFHDTGYAVMLSQSNDYSFDPSKTPATCGSSNQTPTCPWDHITMYRQGTLLWGIEPGGNSAGGDAGVTGSDASSDSGAGATDAAGN